MKKSTVLLIITVVLSAMLLSACGEKASNNTKSDSKSIASSATDKSKASDEIKSLSELPPPTDDDKKLMDKLINKKGEGWLYKISGSEWLYSYVFLENGTRDAYDVYSDEWVYNVGQKNQSWRISNGKLYTIFGTEFVSVQLIEFEADNKFVLWKEGYSKEDGITYTLTKMPDKVSKPQ